MLARIRKAQDEGGFTLIELLVVIIIIGILAAIAIPTFLRQREKGWMAAVKSDVKSVITANESFGTDNDGAYSDDTADGGALTKEGYNKSKDVTVGVTLTGDPVGSEFTVCGSHAKVADKSVIYNSLTGKLEQVEAACGA